MRLNIPIRCDECHTTFNFSPFGMDPDDSITLGGVSAGPCPRCGGFGPIPSGTYSFAKDVQLLLQTGELQFATVFKIHGLLSAAQAAGLSANDAVDEIAETVPEASSLVAIIRKFLNENQGPLAALGIVIMILLWAIDRPAHESHTDVSPPIRVQAAAPAKHPVDQPRPQNLKPNRASAKYKIGRNDLCPCGSGKKTKKCHREKCD